MAAPPLLRITDSLRSLAASARFHRLVWAAWVLGLVLGMLVPVYSDEIGWRIQERAALDGVDKLLSEQCGPATLAAPPWFMWPLRWYSAIFNTLLPEPFWTRVSGVAYALLWAALLLALLRKMVPNQDRRRPIALLVVGLLGLGTLPLQLVWSRPEQPILLCLTSAMLLAWQGFTSAAPRRSLWAGLRVFALLLLAVIAFAYHIKALILVPLFALCIGLSDRAKPTRWIRLGGIAALALLAYQSAHYWLARLSCPGDPVLAAQHAKQSLLLSAKSGIVANLLTIAGNYNLPHYVTLAAPDITPMSSWLLPHLVSKPQQIIWCALMIAAWLAGLILASCAVIGRVRATRWRVLADPRAALAITLFATVSAYCLEQKVRNVYEACFVLPMLALGFACALSASERPGKALSLIAGLLGLAMLTSEALIACIYGPSLLHAAQRGGAIAGQPYSLSIASYGDTRKTIITAAHLCGLDPQAKPPRLLLDDLTYYPFMQSPLPDHVLPVLDPKWNGSLRDPLAYLRSIRSSGMVVQCRHLSPALRRKAHESGGICCMSASDLTQ